MQKLLFRIAGSLITFGLIVGIFAAVNPFKLIPYLLWSTRLFASAVFLIFAGIGVYLAGKSAQE
jgi:hypothetical protein